MYQCGGASCCHLWSRGELKPLSLPLAFPASLSSGGGHHGGPRKLLVDSKPLVSQDVIRSRPELLQSSDPSKRTQTEPRGSAERSRCRCGLLVRRTAPFKPPLALRVHRVHPASSSLSRSHWPPQYARQATGV